jgi:hypothetical protein
MHARIARFEGADEATLEETASRIRQQGEEAGGPPEGVPATGFLLLTDKENGVAMAISLFDNEEDMQKGHETLSAMTPPAGGMGQRTSVEMYEVPVTFQQSSG